MTRRDLQRTSAATEQNPRQLPLQVNREDSVSDRPANDREVFGPRAARLGAPQLLVKALKASANPVSIAVSEPTWSLFFKRLPILVTRVPIAEFSCVHDPWQAVPIVRMSGDYVRSDLGREILQLACAQAVFQSRRSACRRRRPSAAAGALRNGAGDGYSTPLGSCSLGRDDYLRHARRTFRSAWTVH